MNVNKVLKRIFAVALMIFVMLCSTCFVMADSYDGPSPHGETAIINAKDKIANIRRGAGTNYELVGSLLNGSRVEVYGSILNNKKEKWHYIVSNPNGQQYSRNNLLEGWTHDSNIDLNVDDRKIEHIWFSEIQNSEYSNKKVPFGKYIQNDLNQKKEDTIYWRVLEDDENSHLKDDRKNSYCLICDKVIDAVKCKSVKDIKKFLEEDFMKKAFTKKEREDILYICLPRTDFYSNASNGGPRYKISSINTYPTIYVLNKVNNNNKYSPFIKCIHADQGAFVSIENEYGEWINKEAKLGDEYYGIRPIIGVKRKVVKFVDDNEK